MSSLQYKIKYNVARELAGKRLSADHNNKSLEDRLKVWHNLAMSLMDEAENVINNMSNMELLEVLQVVLDVED